MVCKKKKNYKLYNDFFLIFNLIVVPNINEFAQLFQLNESEKENFANVLKAIDEGKVGLPKFIVDSTSEGLNQLADKLIKTGFLNWEWLPKLILFVYLSINIVINRKPISIKRFFFNVVCTAA